jgi:hypothetical protein
MLIGFLSAVVIGILTFGYLMVSTNGVVRRLDSESKRHEIERMRALKSGAR